MPDRQNIKNITDIQNLMSESGILVECPVVDSVFSPTGKYERRLYFIRDVKDAGQMEQEHRLLSGLSKMLTPSLDSSAFVSNPIKILARDSGSDKITYAMSCEVPDTKAFDRFAGAVKTKIRPTPQQVFEYAEKEIIPIRAELLPLAHSADPYDEVNGWMQCKKESDPLGFEIADSMLHRLPPPGGFKIVHGDPEEHSMKTMKAPRLAAGSVEFASNGKPGVTLLGPEYAANDLAHSGYMATQIEALHLGMGDIPFRVERNARQR